MNARAEILRSIQQQLRGVATAPAALPAVATAAPPRFEDQLLAVGARVTRATSATLETTIAHILEAAGASNVVRSTDSFSREQLFAADAGVSNAQWGIAETGTLVLESSQEKHRLVSLVPPLHIAVLPASRIVGTMAEALQRLGPAISSHVVTFITGPSRTGDIELTLVLGVHGPHTLHVIVVDG